MLKPTAGYGGTSSSTSGLAIGIGPAVVPKHLEQSNILTVAQGHEVRLSDSCEWAEPLDAAIVQVVSENLSNLLETDRVYGHSATAGTPMDYQVPLTVVRLGGALGGEAFLDMKWSLLDGQGNELMRKRSSFRRAATGRTYGALASAVSHMLADLSHEIEREIRALGSAPAVSVAQDDLLDR